MDRTQTKTIHPAEVSKLSQREALLRESLGLEDVWAWEFSVSGNCLSLSEETHALLDCRINLFMAFLKIVSQKDRNRVSLGVLRSIRSGRGFLIECQTQAYSSLPPLKIQIHGNYVQGSKGDLFRGLVQNISQARRPPSAIKHSEENFRILSESLPQIVWKSNPDNTISYVNQQWTNITGRTLEDGLGMGWLECIHPDDRHSIINEEHQDYQGPDQPSIELIQRIMTKEGLYRWYLSRAVAVYSGNGEIQYWIGTSTDIDAQKKIEQELDEARMIAIAASEAKSAFLANMSHEIRTPLGIILGYIELMKRQEIGSKMQREFLGAMAKNGKELAELIDSILDLSKIEAQKMELKVKAINVRDQVNNIVQGLRIKADEKKLAIAVEVAADVPQTIISDEVRLRQILVNLVGNAIKFTDRGEIHVEVKTSVAATELIIDIRDTGCGLESNQIDRLFKAFSQIDSTSTRRHGGTGLGLMLSKLLAKALGGDVVLLATKPGGGSTFRVSIRMEEAGSTSVDPKPLKKSSEYEALNLVGVNILLADDAADNQFIFSTFLSAEGASVTVVENGKEALRQGLASEYDLILMDLQMPLMDGYDATRGLRAGGFKNPILALSAYASADDSSKSKLAGCDEHISKPVDFDKLIASIKHHCKQP